MAATALLAGCGETEREPMLTFPASAGTKNSGGAAGVAAQAGVGGVVTSGAGGTTDLPNNCLVDEPNPLPTPPTVDVHGEVRSDGCGKPYTCGTNIRVLETHGTKPADCADKVCGDWSAERRFWVRTPEGYNPNTADAAYPLVIEAPGCGGNVTTVYSLNDGNSSLIRVSIEPGPNSLGHATNPNEGCFDTYEGDDSIDFTLYERLYDKLNAELCFDRRRVFVSGYRSGGTIANELGCKYAGDTLRPLRGVMASFGTVPVMPQNSPTCTSAPLAGLWILETIDQTNPFDTAVRALTRAMSVDGCPTTDYATAALEPFPIGRGNPDDACKRVSGCNPLYPLVMCAFPQVDRGNRDYVANPGFVTFAKSFQVLSP